MSTTTYIEFPCTYYAVMASHFVHFINKPRERTKRITSVKEEEKKERFYIQMKHICMKHNINKSRRLLITSVCSAFCFTTTQHNVSLFVKCKFDIGPLLSLTSMLIYIHNFKGQSRTIKIFSNR